VPTHGHDDHLVGDEVALELTVDAQPAHHVTR
jgi:hypothetical protein